jgi:hypothetical protein
LKRQTQPALIQVLFEHRGLVTLTLLVDRWVVLLFRSRHGFMGRHVWAGSWRLVFRFTVIGLHF